MRIINNKEEWKEVIWNKPEWDEELALVNGKKPRVRKFPVIYYETLEGGGLMGEFLLSNIKKFPKWIDSKAGYQGYFEGFRDAS